ncbi:MAG TPA: hypothetical protein VLA31_08625 [Burkholderiaceae bacterium]|nr:hypothetical protein [Burkholderiaceae bacterium]
MSDLRTAAQQALDALKMMRDEYEEYACPACGHAGAAIYALRSALAEPPTKPLAEWQINGLMADIDPEDVCSWSFRQGVYAAEKHHGVRK